MLQILTFFVIGMLIPFNSLWANDLPDRAGWIEDVRIFPGDLRLAAKLDTGAKSSSIHAENISAFSRDGESWVKFELRDGEGNLRSLERKVYRTVKIKRHKQKSAERPVVLLGLCLGDYFEETEVNLSDRSNYQYPVLVGRIFLSGNFMIDPSIKNFLKPSCDNRSEEE